MKEEGGHWAIEQFYCGRRRNPFGVNLDPPSAPSHKACFGWMERARVHGREHGHDATRVPDQSSQGARAAVVTRLNGEADAERNG